MRILFWTGYRFETYNGNTKSGLGGTETAIMEIAEGLTRYGHEVVVAGELDSSNGEKIRGVRWCSISEFEADFSQVPSNYFDAVVGVNYMHYLRYCRDVGLDPEYKIFWLHNTEFHPWYKSEELETIDQDLYATDMIVTPSQWASNNVLDTIVNPLGERTGKQWSGLIIGAPNGIDPSKFKIKTQKDPNKFIWSSAVDRGLDRLLDNWHKIRSIMPSATLDVYYPKYSCPHGSGKESWKNINGIEDKLAELADQGVNDMGSVSKDELYAAMARATYWMYLTQYEETYCITAQEMQMSDVLCITSNQAALEQVVQEGIILPTDDYETMFDSVVQLLPRVDSGLKRKALKAAKARTKLFTWDNAVAGWHHLLTENIKDSKIIKHEN